MRVYQSDDLWQRGRGLRDLAELRGAGIGSIFSSLFGSVVPFVKSALSVGKRAVKSSLGKKLTKELTRTVSQAGLNVVGDALSGENVLESSKRELAKATKKLGQKTAKVVSEHLNKPDASAKRTPAKGTRAKMKKRQRKRSPRQDLFA